jgi:predicted ATPase
MKIKQLQIENLRVIQNLTLEPGNGINFICGSNGAGKPLYWKPFTCWARAGAFVMPKPGLSFATVNALVW